MKDGYAVEAVARTLFSSRPDAHQFEYQREFTDGRCFIRADIAQHLPDGQLALYEVKSSTSPKDHIADACFQRIVLERSGQKVAAVCVVHVNAHYRRDGELDPKQFLIVANVDDEIAQVRSDVEAIMDRALAILAEDSIDETGCGCVIKSRGRHCASFDHFNSARPDPSVYDLPRMSGARLERLVDDGRICIHDARPDDVTPSQLSVLKAFQSNEPVIDQAAVRDFLGQLTFPLHFYDYETAAGAIPMANGHGPHQQIPVQFSCHVLDESGTLTHAEFLATNHGEEQALVAALRHVIGDGGSVLVWNESFEKSCNTRMTGLLPASAAFLEDLNARTIDLMAPFQRYYIHPGFRGSASIKKVLPVLCPELSYEGLSVHDGTGAILAFREMAECGDIERRNVLRGQLLDYCRLDTLAMVSIYRVLLQI